MWGVNGAKIDKCPGLGNWVESGAFVGDTKQRRKGRR